MCIQSIKRQIHTVFVKSGEEYVLRCSHIDDIKKSLLDAHTEFFNNEQKCFIP